MTSLKMAELKSGFNERKYPQYESCSESPYMFTSNLIIC